MGSRSVSDLGRQCTLVTQCPLACMPAHTSTSTQKPVRGGHSWLRRGRQQLRLLLLYWGHFCGGHMSGGRAVVLEKRDAIHMGTGGRSKISASGIRRFWV